MLKEFLFVGMLTGRPEDEMPGFAGDMLQELSQQHEQARQVMQGIAQALWPSTSLPKVMGELVDMLQGARRHFRLWKMSACRQGAREAWAMVKTCYTKLVDVLQEPYGRSWTGGARWARNSRESSV